MKRARRRPLQGPKWTPPDRDHKYQIGDRVALNTVSVAIAQGAIATIHGIIWKSDGNFKGYWYDVIFDGYVTHHTISEILLDKVNQEL
jgi:hypothetical protein